MERLIDFRSLGVNIVFRKTRVHHIEHLIVAHLLGDLSIKGRFIQLRKDNMKNILLNKSNLILNTLYVENNFNKDVKPLQQEVAQELKRGCKY